MILSTHGIISSAGGVLYDTDAQAFITAAAITDTTQKSAVNTLVTDLKTANIWTKMKALYPFVGGTAASHRFNLKDPRTVNAAFYLDFFGGWIHSATGAKPNGLTTYATTFFNPSINLSSGLSSNHLSTYIRENINEEKIDIGLFGIKNSKGIAIDIVSRALLVSYYQNFIADYAISFPVTDSRGFHVNTRTTSSLQNVYVNSVLKATATNSSFDLINDNISIAARYNNNNNNYELRSSKEFGFISIGDGLTDAEAGNFYTAVQAYNTTLNRQV